MVDVVALKQQLLAQYDLLQNRIKDLSQAAEKEVHYYGIYSSLNFIGPFLNLAKADLTNDILIKKNWMTLYPRIYMAHVVPKNICVGHLVPSLYMWSPHFCLVHFSGGARIFLQEKVGGKNDGPIMLVGPLMNLFHYNLVKISLK